MVTAPTLTGLSPDVGITLGGTTVTISGTNLAGTTAVDFGTTAATSFTVVSSTEVKAVSPAHTPATVTVTLTTPDGVTPTSSADQFTYRDIPPTINGLSPSAGTTAGGTLVTITGAYFLPGATVAFGATSGINVDVVSTSEITVTSPAHGAGSVDVTVTTAEGTSGVVATDRFTFGGPTVSSLSVSAGPTAGGTSVTITGTGFARGASVRFGATSAASVTVVSTTEIVAVSPTRPAGTAIVTVTTPAGASAVSVGAKFHHDARPTVLSVSPASGSPTGGTVVTITGTGFIAGATVAFGTAAGTGVTVVSPTEITVTAPAHAAGTVTVTVTTPGGTSPTTAADQFAY